MNRMKYFFKEYALPFSFAIAAALIMIFDFAWITIAGQPEKQEYQIVRLEDGHAE